MVYESRVGDVFALGSTAWRIVDITHDQVLVRARPGLPGRLPFWKGDTLGRPAELGPRARRVRPRRRRPTAGGVRCRAARGRASTQFAAGNLLDYLAEQQQATGRRAGREEPGGGTVPRRARATGGSSCTRRTARPCMRRGRWSSRPGCGSGTASTSRPCTPTTASCCGCRTSSTRAGEPEFTDLLLLDPADGRGRGDRRDRRRRPCSRPASGSAPPAHCCCRAGRSAGGSRSGSNASGRRSCSRWRPRTRRSRSSPRPCASACPTCSTCRPSSGCCATCRRAPCGWWRSTTPSPSPFASSLLFGYVAQFLYEGDSPLAERRAAALTVDPTLLAELLGHGDGLALRDLLDPQAVARHRGRAAAARRGPPGPIVDEIADLLRILGPLTTIEIDLRSTVPRRRGRAARNWRARPAGDRRCGSAVSSTGPTRPTPRRCATRSAPPCRRASPSRCSSRCADPLGRLVGRFARTHGPFLAARAGTRFGLGVAVVTDALRRLVGTGRLAEGEFRPLGDGPRRPASGGPARRVRRRRGAPAAAPPVARPRCGPRWSRSSRRRSPGSCRPGTASA